MAAVRHLGFAVRMRGTTHEVLYMVFITVQNLVGIGWVVLVISKFNGFSLVRNCLFTPLWGRFFWGLTPKMGRNINGTPKGTSLRRTTPFDILSVNIGASVRSGRDPKYKVKKNTSLKKPKHVTCHVFAETTHVVAAPPNFAGVVLPPTWLYILGVSSKSVEGFRNPRGSKIWLPHYFR